MNTLKSMRGAVVMIVGLLLVLSAVALMAKEGQKAGDPTAVGPDIYKVQLDNERVRIMEATFEPGDKIALHSHPDHAAYILEGGKLRLSPEGKEPQEMDLKAGQTVWIPAEAHAAENIGDTRVKVLVIEMKDAMPGKAAMKQTGTGQ